MHFRTRAIHIGQHRDEATGAVVPPIHVASTFGQNEAGKWREFDRSRSGNPTRKNFETTLASLEGGTGALAFASGMAATACVIASLSSGDHVVTGHDLSGGTYPPPPPPPHPPPTPPPPPPSRSLPPRSSSGSRRPATR